MSEWTIQRRILSTPEGPQWELVAQRGDAVERAGSLRVRFDAGQATPRHWYHLGTAMHGAAEIGVMRAQRTLTLCSDLVGATELFDLQGDGEAAAWLVRAALLWLARDGCTTAVFAELPGLREAAGAPPRAGTTGSRGRPEDSAFFQAIGRHFLPGGSLGSPDDPARWPPHLAGLLPRHPLYAALLPPPVQATIGRTQDAFAAWMAALEQEGFSAGRAVTVVDGGPVHEGRLNASATARGAGWRELRVGSGSIAGRVLLLADDPAIAMAVRGRCDEGFVSLEDALSPAPPDGRVWCAALVAAPAAPGHRT